MAEGGYDPTDSTEKTPLIPSAGDDDDGEDNTGIDWDNVDWNVPVDPEPDRRNPFEPAASSTPADSERLPLKTMTRLPPRNKGPLPRPLSLQGLIKAFKPSTAW